MKTILPLIFLLTGCADPKLDPSKTENTKAVQVAIDEIKLISPNVQDPADAKTIRADEYPIHQQSRLLMRFGSLKASISSILEEQPVLLRLHLKKNSIAMVEQLSVCPITTNWMMYATWDKPFPYSKNKWRSVGGDFDQSSCMTPLKKDDLIFKDKKEETAFCANDNTVCFNIGSPFVDAYIRSRGVDYGLAVVSNSPDSILMYGDTTVLGPEIFWRKLKY